MAQPAISTSDPADAATDVFVNVSLTVTFSAALLESSVTTTTVLLEESGSGELVACTVELETSTLVRITPIGALAEDTLYKIKFPGTDIALSNSFVIKDNAVSEALTTTLSISFRTGSRSYIDDTDIDKNATDLSLEGDLNLPVHVKALGDLAISATTPKLYSYDLTGVASVDIEFNNTLDSGVFSTDWMTVDVFPLLDNSDHLAVSGTFTGVALPTYTVSYTGAHLIATFSEHLPQNVGVEVTVDKDVTDIDGSEFGPNSYLLSFTTERYPNYSGIHTVKRELKAIKDELTNDYITATLFSNSIKFIVRYNEDDVNEHLIQRWVLSKSIVDILDDKELEKAIVAGTRRHLGDMSVSVDPIVGKLALKHKRAEDEADRISRTITRAIAKSYSLEGQSSIVRTYRRWPGVNNRIVEARFVYWQPDIPAANLSSNRQAKNTNYLF